MSRSHGTRLVAWSPDADAEVTGGTEAGPTVEELDAIALEEPLIAAEVALTDAEIRVLTAAYPTALDWRRVRRAELAVGREALAYVARLARDGSPVGLAA